MRISSFTRTAPPPAFTGLMPNSVSLELAYTFEAPAHLVYFHSHRMMLTVKR